MSTIRVRVELQNLFCFHGADEDTSEPYLWTIVFTIDGRTITHEPNEPKLTGKPAFFFGPGSHGNLGPGVGIGENRPIPPAVGRVDTTLQPIVLNALGQTLELPGQLGVIAILLEENATPSDAAEAAHQAINNLVQTELEEAIEDVNLVGILAEAAPAIAAGTSPFAAVQPILRERMDRVRARIDRFASDVAVATIVQHMRGLGAIPGLVDPDAQMGTLAWSFSQGELEATDHRTRKDLDETIRDGSGGPLEASDFIYNLHGQVWQPVEVFFTPITGDVPPGRWQITGTARGFTRTRSFIDKVGGAFADGSPWVLESGTAMSMIRNGTHTFFVRGSSGVEADLTIDPNDENPNFPFLTTVADNDPTNNLTRLPACPVSIRHVRDVP